MDHSALHQRAREKGVQPIIYWIVRAVLQPFFHLYFRLSRIGLEHVPGDGPYIVAANHRSFLDPFIIAVIARRPLYYVAKRELFEKRWQGWLLNALGAFPVDRGAGDQEMLATARAILARGDSVLIFPEGTRIRPGALGRPKRGVGRLALEAGVPVVPVAVIGTETIRRGWRIRPHKVRMRVGKPLTFPQVEQPSKELAAAVTDRIWPCVMLQWEWLGGLPPLRSATVLGPDEDGVAAALASAGITIGVGGDGCDAGDHAVVFSGVLPSTADLERAGTTRIAHVTGSGPFIISAADRGLGRQLRDVFAAVGREATVERVAA
jgi:1-acyl-sn-glycerol-3-phosphate acyltransferase